MSYDASMLDVVPCEHCTSDTEFTTEIAPLGSNPGHRVYFCQSCKRHTWTTWRIERHQQQADEYVAHANDAEAKARQSTIREREKPTKK